MSAEPSAVSLNVVVPALNEEHRLGHLTSDIGRQTRRSQEVIVVDAGSHDGAIAVAEGFEGVRVLRVRHPSESATDPAIRHTLGEQRLKLGD